jgi:hypothetical protein
LKALSEDGAFFYHPLLIRNRIKRRNGIPLRFTLGASQGYAENAEIVLSFKF